MLKQWDNPLAEINWQRPAAELPALPALPRSKSRALPHPGELAEGVEQAESSGMWSVDAALE